MLRAQLWHFQPGVQRAVNASLRELKGLNNPTVAFHIRGGDLSADLQNNVRAPPLVPFAMCSHRVMQQCHRLSCRALGVTARALRLVLPGTLWVFVFSLDAEKTACDAQRLCGESSGSLWEQGEGEHPAEPPLGYTACIKQAFCLAFCDSKYPGGGKQQGAGIDDPLKNVACKGLRAEPAPAHRGAPV